MKKHILTLVAFGAVLSFAACDTDSKNKPVGSSQENTDLLFEASVATTCSTHKSTEFAADAIIKRETIELVRERILMARLDCNNKIISEDIEIIQHPIAEKIIEAETASHWSLLSKKLGARSAYNRTTCTEARFDEEKYPHMIDTEGVSDLNLDGSYNINMVVEYGPSPKNTPVVQGYNYIDYEFKNVCDANQKGCKVEVVEHGTLVLEVKFKDIPYNTATGKRKVIRPVIGECKSI